MINKQLFENCTFNWTELHGKELKISVGQSIDNLAKEMITVVMGYEESTGKYYTIHQEVKRL